MTAISETSEAVARPGERDIVTSRLFDAPRELVFRLWTEAEHIGRWWGPRGFTTTTHEMDVSPGGEWKFVMHGPDGTDYDNHIVYEEVVAPERLVYQHGPGPQFHVTVTFEAEGERTRVNMRTVFESNAIRDRVIKSVGALDGMNQTLERLGEELARTTTPPFSISRTFDAPRDLVYKVWTEAEHLAGWFGPKGTKIIASSNDLRRGGTYHYGMQTPDGNEMWGRWLYREITPLKRLVFISSFSDKDGAVAKAPFPIDWPLEVLASVEFTENDGKTTVTVEWTPVNATESQRTTFASMHASMQGGWTGTFEQLEQYLAELQ